MKKTAERETSKSTPGYSGREMHAPKSGDKRYIYRNDTGHFASRPDGHSSKYGNGYHIMNSPSIRPKSDKLLITGTTINFLQPLPSAPPPPVEESPDFTEADKEWIDKIDRTQLSWDEW